MRAVGSTTCAVSSRPARITVRLGAGVCSHPADECAALPRGPAHALEALPDDIAEASLAHELRVAVPSRGLRRSVGVRERSDQRKQAVPRRCCAQHPERDEPARSVRGQQRPPGRLGEHVGCDRGPGARATPCRTGEPARAATASSAADWISSRATGRRRIPASLSADFPAVAHRTPSPGAGHHINGHLLAGVPNSIGCPDTPVPPLNIETDSGGRPVHLLASILARIGERSRSRSGCLVETRIQAGTISLATGLSDARCARRHGRRDRVSALRPTALAAGAERRDSQHPNRARSSGSVRLSRKLHPTPPNVRARLYSFAHP